MSTPAPAGLRAAAGPHGRPAAKLPIRRPPSRPSWHRSDHGFSRYPQDPDRPLQGLVAARRRRQGSQTFDTRDQARDFKHHLLARLARGNWVDPRLGKQQFETWAREWWDSWSADPDHSPRTLQAAEARLRRHLLPTLGKRQLRAITVSVVRQWQNDLRGKVGYDTVMACRSLLYRILQAAEDDRRIEANPVRKVPAPKPPVDPGVLLGRR
jgi:Phage integrase, N-terminal SAM-like domain